jgi:ribosomal-protein-alanine N-acetyltransferase
MAPFFPDTSLAEPDAFPRMTTFGFPTFPTLRTPRFLLRQITQDDLPAVFRGLSDPRVIANYGVSYACAEQTQRQMDWFEEIYATGTGIWWAVCRSSERPALIGAVGLNDIAVPHRRGELGYWLLPEHWGQGIARECVAAMLEFAFGSLRLHRVGADVDIDNQRSCNLLDSLGFHFEGVRRGCELKAGEFLDLKIYSRLATDSRPCADSPPG